MKLSIWILVILASLVYNSDANPIGNTNYLALKGARGLHNNNLYGYNVPIPSRSNYILIPAGSAGNSNLLNNNIIQLGNRKLSNNNGKEAASVMILGGNQAQGYNGARSGSRNLYHKNLYNNPGSGQTYVLVTDNTGLESPSSSLGSRSAGGPSGGASYVILADDGSNVARRSIAADNLVLVVTNPADGNAANAYYAENKAYGPGSGSRSLGAGASGLYALGVDNSYANNAAGIVNTYSAGARSLGNYGSNLQGADNSYELGNTNAYGPETRKSYGLSALSKSLEAGPAASSLYSTIADAPYAGVYGPSASSRSLDSGEANLYAAGVDNSYEGSYVPNAGSRSMGVGSANLYAAGTGNSYASGYGPGKGSRNLGAETGAASLYVSGVDSPYVDAYGPGSRSLGVGAASLNAAVQGNSYTNAYGQSAGSRSLYASGADNSYAGAYGPSVSSRSYDGATANLYSAGASNSYAGVYGSVAGSRSLGGGAGTGASLYSAGADSAYTNNAAASANAYSSGAGARSLENSNSNSLSDSAGNTAGSKAGASLLEAQNDNK